MEQIRQALLREYAELLEPGQDHEERRSGLRRGCAAIICKDNLVVDGLTREALAETAVREIAGFGPIEPLLDDPLVTDVMVNRPNEIYFEREGVLRRSDLSYRDEKHVRESVARILAPLGRRLDNLIPFVDARLPDGSRLNVIIPPLATGGCTITIRRFRKQPLSVDELIALELLTDEVASLLRAVVACRLNLLISGGAGSGKTTLLNALCLLVPQAKERLVAIEDAAELRLESVHAVNLEARPANLEGLGEVTIRQLVRNALRMRPDRLVLGEVRDEAAYDFVSAINTGHAGSMCTIHANSAQDALFRLETLALMSAGNVVLAAVRDQITSALDIVVHLARSESGKRQVAEIAVLAGVSRGADPVTVCVWPPPRQAETVLVLHHLQHRSTRRGAVHAVAGLLRTARELLSGGVPGA
ncbi:MAG: CpaF family protein [Bacillota bacterium]|nr:CpaF family protein [Bacillota bacterium]